jgi:hypothetical protein
LAGHSKQIRHWSLMRMIQIPERVGRLEPVQLETGGPLDARQRLDALPGGEGRRSAVSIADDHSRHDRTNYELRHA